MRVRKAGLMGISTYSACKERREDVSSDETNIRARSEHAIATRRIFVMYDGKDSVDSLCDEFLEIPWSLSFR